MALSSTFVMLVIRFGGHIQEESVPLTDILSYSLLLLLSLVSVSDVFSFSGFQTFLASIHFVSVFGSSFFGGKSHF